MKRPRLVVFDLDGTLINSSLDLCNSVNAAMQGVGKGTLPNAVIATYIGDGAAMLVRRALGDPGDLDAANPSAGDALFHRAFEFFLEHYREHKLDNTRCYDGVLDSLRAIRERNPQLPMAVLTNKPVNPSRQICDALALSPFFFQNYGGNSFTTKKPDPEGLLTLMREAQELLERAAVAGRGRDDRGLGCGRADRAACGSPCGGLFIWAGAALAAGGAAGPAGRACVGVAGGAGPLALPYFFHAPSRRRSRTSSPT